jgi:predicted nuclease of predicted toxin-antitoxin system
MLFLIDENVSNFVVRRLMSDGHNMVTVSTAHRGVKDDVVLALAETGQRILITGDRDFGELIVR